jgi:hypothetical protein
MFTYKNIIIMQKQVFWLVNKKYSREIISNIKIRLLRVMPNDSVAEWRCCKITMVLPKDDGIA